MTVPGWVAEAGLDPQTGGPQAITLATHEVRRAGRREPALQDREPPAHGTLDVATGRALHEPAVTYTPAAGYAGADSFTYVAIYNGSGLPAQPGAGRR